MGTVTMATNKTSKIEIRAEPEWVAMVHAAASRKKLSASAYARMVIAERMEQDGFAINQAKRKPKSPE